MSVDSCNTRQPLRSSSFIVDPVIKVDRAPKSSESPQPHSFTFLSFVRPCWSQAGRTLSWVFQLKSSSVTLTNKARTRENERRRSIKKKKSERGCQTNLVGHSGEPTVC